MAGVFLVTRLQGLPGVSRIFRSLFEFRWSWLVRGAILSSFRHNGTTIEFVKTLEASLSFKSEQQNPITSSKTTITLKQHFMLALSKRRFTILLISDIWEEESQILVGIKKPVITMHWTLTLSEGIWEVFYFEYFFRSHFKVNRLTNISNVNAKSFVWLCFIIQNSPLCSSVKFRFFFK